jgi:hypothetical protein
MSGYSKPAKEGASGPRSLILMLDYSRLYLLLTGAMSFTELIERIRDTLLRLAKHIFPSRNSAAKRIWPSSDGPERSMGKCRADSPHLS